MTIITAAQAENIITAASIRDMLNGNGGITLTGNVAEQHTTMLADTEAAIPAAILRAANVAIANRPEGAPRSRAAFAWVSAQNVTD